MSVLVNCVLCLDYSLLNCGVELFAMKGCKYVHVCFPADVKKYALHGGRHCLWLNNKDGMMVCDCFRPVTGGVACWVDTLFYFCCLCVHVSML